MANESAKKRVRENAQQLRWLRMITFTCAVRLASRAAACVALSEQR